MSDYTKPVIDNKQIPLPTVPRDMSHIESYLAKHQYNKSLDWLIKYQGQELLVLRKAERLTSDNHVELTGNNALSQNTLRSNQQKMEDEASIVEDQTTGAPLDILDELNLNSFEDFITGDYNNNQPPIPEEIDLEETPNEFSGEEATEHVYKTDDTTSFVIRGLLSTSNYGEVQFNFTNIFDKTYLHCKEPLLPHDIIKPISNQQSKTYVILNEESIGLIDTVYHRYLLAVTNE